MRVRLWGTRGSVAAPGQDTARYGGNTSTVEVRGPDGTLLILDAGTGIRPLARTLDGVRRIDVFLSHLHMDHIQGLGFFAPLFGGDVPVHLWGPAATSADLRLRLSRYLSPPLFPVHLRDLAHVTLHAFPSGPFEIRELRVWAERTCHPGLTVGFRIEHGEHRIAYLSDHEPALGNPAFPGTADWTSGHALAEGVDLLLHDGQYAREEYPEHVGWGHSSVDHAIAFARLAGVRRLVTFHHDPAHDDDAIDRITADAVARLAPPFPVVAGAEGMVLDV